MDRRRRGLDLRSLGPDIQISAELAFLALCGARVAAADTWRIDTLYARRRSAMGLVPLPGWRAKLMVLPKAGLTLVAFALVVALTTIAGPALGLAFLTEVPAGVDDRWGEVAGSLPHYLLWLGIVWTAAAFGEEMFFRGYLVTRLQLVFPDGAPGLIFAVVVSALIFGYGHFYYQGWRGAVVTCGIGLAFGTMFLLFKRNLWPLILLHGIIDTLTFTAIFMGSE
ncbi:MAG: CPBP family intramembrane metalloprotease [Proteobacteria bacterium]|nr:CPBP family intramembrane metalloprotease [Pseudomonadota bacterium]